MQGETNARLVKVAEADFPTEFGHFRIFGFEGHSAASGTEEFVAIALGDLANGHPVLAREGRTLVASFHPELTDDTRIHEQFLNLVREEMGVRA